MSEAAVLQVEGLVKHFPIHGGLLQRRVGEVRRIDDRQTGDGGFGQYAMEFTTLVKYGMDITHVLLNNAQLGKIAKEQRAGEWPVWETSLHNPSFAMFARQCGGLGLKVTTADGLDRALAEALAHKGPSLVEVMTDAELV